MSKPFPCGRELPSKSTAGAPTAVPASTRRTPGSNVVVARRAEPGLDEIGVAVDGFNRDATHFPPGQDCTARYQSKTGTTLATVKRTAVGPGDRENTKSSS